MPIRLHVLFALVAVACQPGCGHKVAPEAHVPPSTALSAEPLAAGPALDVEALLAAPDRDSEDRALDAQRKPAALLGFAGIRGGMRVAELGAGTGYTAELLARAVGETGAVFAQNPRFVLERFAQEPWSRRLQKPSMQHVVRLDREFDDPFPSEVRDLDAVFLVLFYHDTYWMEIDRARMNRAVLAALKPGGAFIVVDHSAREGHGSQDVKTLHRVEERLVREELELAGFVIDAEAGFLRNPQDARDWNAAPGAAGAQRGQSDRFVLRATKPR
jgi:predicted methyltransferase